MFVVSGGDGVLEGHKSCTITITTKPTSLYGSPDDIPVVKFAFELVEADEVYSEQSARDFWKENGAHCVRKSVTTHVTLQPNHKKSELDRAKEMNMILDSLKGRLTNGHLNYAKPNATKIEIDKVGSAVKNFPSESGGGGRAVRADHTIMSRPRGRILDLLIFSLGSHNSPSASEFEVISRHTLFSALC